MPIVVRHVSLCRRARSSVRLGRVNGKGKGKGEEEEGEGKGANHRRD